MKLFISFLFICLCVFLQAQINEAVPKPEKLSIPLNSYTRATENLHAVQPQLHFPHHYHDDCEDSEANWVDKEFRFKQTSGSILISGGGNIKVSTYDGDEIIVLTTVKQEKKDEKKNTNDRAAGLKKLSATGLESYQNSGFSIDQVNNELIITELHSFFVGVRRPITLTVPKNISITIKDDSFGTGAGTIEFNDFEEAIDISTQNHSIVLHNVTGPMAIKSLYGGIEAKFDKLTNSGTVNLSSVYSYVDVALPGKTSADVKFTTTYGEIYTDFEVDIDKKQSNEIWGSKKIKGKLNNGGLPINLKSTYGPIYIRKS